MRSRILIAIDNENRFRLIKEELKVRNRSLSVDDWHQVSGSNPQRAITDYRTVIVDPMMGGLRRPGYGVAILLAAVTAGVPVFITQNAEADTFTNLIIMEGICSQFKGICNNIQIGYIPNFFSGQAIKKLIFG